MWVDHIASWLGVSREHVVAPLFTFGSAVIGGSVAIWAIRTNRTIARMKNSMDFINRTNENDRMWRAIAEVHDFYKQDGTHGVELLGNDDNRDVEHAKYIREILNYYEAMAACVQHKIYDDRFLREMLYTTVMDVWMWCLPYVRRRRDLKGKNTFFQELECLVDRWEKNQLKEKKKRKANGN